jgi:hypothetical protein
MELDIHLIQRGLHVLEVLTDLCQQILPKAVNGTGLANDLGWTKRSH